MVASKGSPYFTRFVDGRAALPGVGIRAACRETRRLLQIRILEHDEGIVAA
jgi:hypothetical protein